MPRVVENVASVLPTDREARALAGCSPCSLEVSDGCSITVEDIRTVGPSGLPSSPHYLERAAVESDDVGLASLRLVRRPRQRPGFRVKGGPRRSRELATA